MPTNDEIARKKALLKKLEANYKPRSTPYTGDPFALNMGVMMNLFNPNSANEVTVAPKGSSLSPVNVKLKSSGTSYPNKISTNTNTRKAQIQKIESTENKLTPGSNIQPSTYFPKNADISNKSVISTNDEWLLNQYPEYFNTPQSGFNRLDMVREMGGVQSGVQNAVNKVVEDPLKGTPKYIGNDIVPQSRNTTGSPTMLDIVAQNNFSDKVDASTKSMKLNPMTSKPMFETNNQVQGLAKMKTMTEPEIKAAKTKIAENEAAFRAKGGYNETPANFGLTTGDWIGMAGTVAGGIAQIANTISAAKATKDNVNRYLGYNEKALASNKKSQMQIDENEAVAKREMIRRLITNAGTAKTQNRKGAMGMNTLRAMDLATDVNTNEAQINANNQIEQIFGNQMLQALGTEQQLLSQKDQMEMSAWERVDDKDQMDLDNTYSNFAQNFATITQNVQTLGANINRAKERQMFIDMLPNTNAFGVTINPKTGEMEAKPGTNIAYAENPGTKIIEKPIENNFWKDGKPKLFYKDVPEYEPFNPIYPLY